MIFPKTIAASLLLAVSLFAQTPPLPQQNNRKTLNHPRGFSLQYPADWTVELNDGFTRLLPPGTPSPAESYRVISQEVPVTANDPRFARELDIFIEQLDPTMQRAGDPIRFTSHNGPALKFVYQGEKRQDGSVNQISVYAVTISNLAVLLFASGNPAQLEARDAVLRDIAASFAWGRKQSAVK